MACYRANELCTDHRQFDDSPDTGLLCGVDQADLAFYLVGLAWGNETKRMDAR
jgi:hypothetical protein